MKISPLTWIATLMVFIFVIPCQAQSKSGSQSLSFPVVGKPCPDFTLTNIKYYDKTSANMRQFRGKWLLLDFWNRYCSGCIASFPRINEKRKKFAGKMEILTVGGYFPDGLEDTSNERRRTEEIYDNVVKKENLNLPCAFDSGISKKWDVFFVPFIVVIDPKGVVRAVTTNIGDDKIDSLLKGFSPQLRTAIRGHEDVGPEARTPIGKIVFTALEHSKEYTGPRFAFANDNDFAIMVSTDNSEGWDSLPPRTVGRFHNGDYRTYQQVYNVTYEASYNNFRGRINALKYDWHELEGAPPTGDWIIHFKWDKTWSVRAVKLDY